MTIDANRLEHEQAERDRPTHSSQASDPVDAPRRLVDPAPRRDWVSGIVLLVVGTIAFSSAGFFVRLIGRDAATILFWRGLFTGLAVTAFIAWRHGRGTWDQFRGIGLPGVWVALLAAVSMGSFVTSLQYTTVANNSIIFGTAPFLTAGLAWLLIRERPSTVTLVCSAIALVGAVLVVGSSLRLSGAALVGDALALLMTLAFAVKTVLVRQHSKRSMVAAGCLGALFGSIGAAPFVRDWTIGWGEIGLFALFGFTQQGAGLILTTLGTAKVPAAQAALIMALDLPLSPMWVWAAFGEKPAPLALLGGAVVLAAIIAHIVIEGRRQR